MILELQPFSGTKIDAGSSKNKMCAVEIQNLHSGIKATNVLKLVDQQRHQGANILHSLGVACLYTVVDKYPSN